MQEFKPDGTFLRQFGTAGTATNQLTEPRGIAAAPGNEVLIADAGNHRLARWTHADKNPQSGAAKVEVKVDGSAAKTEAPGCLTRNCQISGSWTMNADSYPGGSHKVEVITTDGVGLTTTKTLNVETHGDYAPPQIALSGTMTEQATKGTTLPTYKLRAAATDPGSAEERKSGVASETIKFDGTVVDSSSPGCPAEGCSLTREWTLESSTKSVGSHKIEVIATDAAGHTTTKTLEIKIERDETAPTFETGSEKFFTAPSGWLEQKSYPYIVFASDENGYGVTSLQLKIDGAVVKSASGTCSEGGCEKYLWSSINMANYSGGSHPAELVATDGAGNVRKRTWTINVDPDGHITLGEAEDTLEAADTTSEASVVAPTSEALEPQEIEAGDNPGLKQAGEELISTGVPDKTTMTTNPNSGFIIQSPEGNVSVTPLGGEPASNISIAEGVAGVAANTGEEVDSVIRPEYNGTQTFQAIRSAESTNEFSWRINLAEDQILRVANPTQVEVLYGNGHLAYLVTAETAHDATGANVPTSLSVNGNVLTLKVASNSGGYVYPIVAGQAWETGYLVPVVIEGPEDEAEIRQREQEEREEELGSESEGSLPPPPPPPLTQSQAERYVMFGALGTDPAPPPYPEGGATASAVRTFQIYRSQCGRHCDWWKAKLYNASFIRYYESAKWEPGTQVWAHVDQATAFEATINTTTWNCGTFGPSFVKKQSGEHMTAFGHFTIETWWVPPASETMFPAENNFALQDWIYPNGYQEKHVKDWSGEPNAGGTCPTVAG